MNQHQDERPLDEFELQDEGYEVDWRGVDELINFCEQDMAAGQNQWQVYCQQIGLTK